MDIESQGTAKTDEIEWLNRECFCVSLDHEALRTELDAELGTRELPSALVDSHPHLFAALPVFVSSRHVAQMADIIAAVEMVVGLAAYRSFVLQFAPKIARFDPGPRGVFLGYDFHLDAEGPKLIEINTNAGGALLNIVLGRAQRACCPPIEHLVPGHPALSSIESAIFQMFLEEWRLQRGDAPLRHVAIVDDRPREQYLYPEFLLFQQLFRRHGIEASILSAEEIQSSHNALWAGKTRIDLIYNRMTDFSLGLPVHAAVREAYINDEVVVTPHPRAHALYADKRNLAVLSDRERLRGWGVPERVVEVLCSGVPQTRLVDAAATDELWMNRRKFFFKPAAGFGSRAAYRGEKITRRVWQEILSGSYVAQAFVPPSQRVIQDAAVPLALKLDIRNYVYNGRVLLLAARLYQGQTTNFRTPGGGFAPVFTGHRPTTAKEDAKCGLPAHGLSG